MLTGTELKIAQQKVRDRYPAAGPYVLHFNGCAQGVLPNFTCDCGLIFDLFRFGGVTGEGTEDLYPKFKDDLALSLKTSARNFDQRFSDR